MLRLIGVCLKWICQHARATKQFNKWLAAPKIPAQLKRYKEEKRGKSDKWKDRLKDLAMWRLYRENGNDFEKANQFANDNRKRFKTWPEIHATCKKVNGNWPYKLHDPRPFRDAKRTGDDAVNVAPLLSCDDDYRRAKGETIKLLAELMPSDEFKKSSFDQEIEEWKRDFESEFKKRAAE